MLIDDHMLKPRQGIGTLSASEAIDQQQQTTLRHTAPVLPRFAFCSLLQSQRLYRLSCAHMRISLPHRVSIASWYRIRPEMQWRSVQ